MYIFYTYIHITGILVRSAVSTGQLLTTGASDTIGGITVSSTWSTTTQPVAGNTSIAVIVGVVVGVGSVVVVLIIIIPIIVVFVIRNRWANFAICNIHVKLFE